VFLLITGLVLSKALQWLWREREDEKLPATFVLKGSQWFEGMRTKRDYNALPKASRGYL